MIDFQSREVCPITKMPDPVPEAQEMMSKQAAEDFIQKVFMQQKLILEQEQKENLLMARKLKIQTDVYKFSRPADKRAMKFIMVGIMTFVVSNSN